MESEHEVPDYAPLYPGNNWVTDNLALEAAENIANAAFATGVGTLLSCAAAAANDRSFLSMCSAASTALSSFSTRAMRSANILLAPDRRKPAHRAC